MIRRVSEHVRRMAGGALSSLVVGAMFAVAATLNATSVLAESDHPTPADLVARGWTCVTPPTPNRIVCSHPNQGFPTFGNPPPEDRPASFSLWMFDGAGNFIGPYTLLRSDLYHGEPCDGTGAPWIFRPAVGYYECVHKVAR